MPPQNPDGQAQSYLTERLREMGDALRELAQVAHASNSHLRRSGEVAEKFGRGLDELRGQLHREFRDLLVAVHFTAMEFERQARHHSGGRGPFGPFGPSVSLARPVPGASPAPATARPQASPFVVGQVTPGLRDELKRLRVGPNGSPRSDNDFFKAVAEKVRVRTPLGTPGELDYVNRLRRADRGLIPSTPSYGVPLAPRPAIALARPVPVRVAPGAGLGGARGGPGAPSDGASGASSVLSTLSVAGLVVGGFVAGLQAATTAAVGWASALGNMVEAASPQTWRTFTGSVEILMARIGVTLIPAFVDLARAAQGAADNVSKMSDARKEYLSDALTLGPGRRAAGDTFAGPKTRFDKLFGKDSTFEERARAIPVPGLPGEYLKNLVLQTTEAYRRTKAGQGQPGGIVGMGVSALVGAQNQPLKMYAKQQDPRFSNVESVWENLARGFLGEDDISRELNNIQAEALQKLITIADNTGRRAPGV